MIRLTGKIVKIVILRPLAIQMILIIGGISLEYVYNKNLITDITKNSEFTHKLRDTIILLQGNIPIQEETTQ
jgi:hypothetical protein